jgi:hypothetical protein
VCSSIKIIDWAKNEFNELISEYITKSRPALIGPYPIRFEFLIDQKTIAEYSAATSEFSINTQDNKEAVNIIDSLNRSGLAVVDTTFMFPIAPAGFPHSSTSSPEWAKWFFGFTNLSDGFIIDTNMIMNHYCSNILFKKIGVAFDGLKIRIPRLSILEIERKANEDDKMKKRIGLFATSEIIFLKNHNAQLLPPLDPVLLTSFSEKAGSKNIDSWIRKEVSDFIASDTSNLTLPPIFATCDVANGLAAFSEDINTCVFSRNAYERFFIDINGHNTSNLTELIVNLAITFQKIGLKVYSDGKNLTKAYVIEGIWTGKTPSDWMNGTMYVHEVP